MAFFSKRGVWHSYLKAQSPIVIRFKNPPVLSKYPNKDGGDQWLIYFQVRGDSATEEYYYFIESEEIRDKLNEVEYGVWYSVTAGGGKDGQWLNIEPAGDATNTVTASNNSGHGDDNYSSGIVSADYQRCLEEAKGIAKNMFGTDSIEAVHPMAATMLINWHQRGYRVPLNEQDAPEREYVDEDNTSEYVAKIENLVSQLTKRSGKAHDGKALKTAVDKIEAALEGNIDAQTFGKIAGWLDAEIAFQKPEEEEYSDDLPF